MSENEQMGFEEEIVIDTEYSIRKDYRSWNLIYRLPIPKKTNPKEMREHYEVTYHVSLGDLLTTYIDKKGKKAGTMPEALELIKAAEKRVELLCKDFPNAFSKEFQK
jgi:hypothetical protein